MNWQDIQLMDIDTHAVLEVTLEPFVWIYPLNQIGEYNSNCWPHGRATSVNCYHPEIILAGRRLNDSKWLLVLNRWWN
jgi:hypothetical protein